MADPIPAAAPVEAPKATDSKVVPEAATETIKVNGKEIKVTKSQLIAAAQKGYFADQKLKSMDVLSKNTTALLSDIKTPEGLLKILKDPALGANPKEILRKLISSDLVDEEILEDIAKLTHDRWLPRQKMTPEQIENEKKLSDYARLKKAEEDRKKSAETEKNRAEVDQVYQHVRGEVSKQIVADKTFPQTEGSIRAVISTLKAMNKGGAPVTPENISKALSKVKKDHLIHQQTMFDAIKDDEGLISLLGESRALRISKALVARLKTKGAAKAAAASEPVVGEKSRQEKYGIDRHGYTILDV